MNSTDYIKSELARKEILELFSYFENDTQIQKLTDFIIPQTLYKYSSINKYLIDHLKNNSLSASSPTKFNDLYDSTMHFDTASKDIKRHNELNEGSRKLGLKEVISDEMKEILLKRSKEIDEHSLTYLTKDFRIICLSSFERDIKMWSHYSNNNKGICLAYDFTNSNLSDLIYPIFYITKPIDVTVLCEDDNKIMLAALISVISKFRDWEHENEWRIVFYFFDDGQKRLKIHGIPKPKFILLGNRFIENIQISRFENYNEYLLIEEFLNYVKDEGIILKIIKPQIRSYKLEYENIEINEVLKELY
ncbi:MAG: DUF2971 domain-containing protein [Melioribacteraceae bacterium]